MLTFNNTSTVVMRMNFDLLPGSNVNRYTGKEFPSKWNWFSFGGGGGGGIMSDQPNFASYTPEYVS